MNDFLLLVSLSFAILTLMVVGLVLLWRARPVANARRLLLFLLTGELLLAALQPGILPGIASYLNWNLNLGGEYRLAVALVSAQLVMAAVAALKLAWQPGSDAGDSVLLARVKRLYWLVLGAGLLFLALDEFFLIHETNQEFWRPFYLLIGAAVGLLTLLLMLRSSRRLVYGQLLSGMALMVTGGILLDIVKGRVRRLGVTCDLPDWLVGICESWDTYLPFMHMLEEVGEMVGVTFLLGAFLTLLPQNVEPGRRLARRLIDSAGPLAAALVLAAFAAWMWLTPAVQLHFNSERVLVEYLDGDLALMGYRLEGAPASPGARVDVILYLQARRALPEPPLLVSLHALKLPDFDSIEQDDDPQIGTLVPSTGFVPGTIVHKAMKLDLPEDTPTGHYALMLRIWTGEPPWTHTIGVDVSATDRQLINPDMVLFAGLDVIAGG
ncbi:MAG: hypothetical protein OXF44_11130 [Anaerolineaceae bacterium]|nr:hypothetical protein [Anaerolineaceae bacterium]